MSFKNQDDHISWAAHQLAACVNLSFACEIAMKAFIENPPKDHNLQLLFGLIPENHQVAVRNYVKYEMKLDSEDFDRILGENKEAFEDWRYLFEENHRFKSNPLQDGRNGINLKFIEHLTWALIEEAGEADRLIWEPS